MGELHDALKAARAKRDRHTKWAFFIGLVIGSIVARDILVGLVSGLLIASIVGIISSRDVDTYTRIQNIRRR